MNLGLLIKNGMVKKVNKILKNKWFFYTIIFFLFMILCYLFPYSHDDWAWGSIYGIERLESHFEGYNGRWIGNFVVLALTRSNLLKTMAMSFSLTFILFCINELSSKKNKLASYLSFFLLLAIPYLVLREAIVWTSGFANYVASIVFVFLFIYLNKNLFYEEEKDCLWKKIVFFIIGFITVLFVEHVTLYVLALGIFSVGYHYFKTKKISWSLVLYLMGAIIGTIVMFSNSAYSNISSGQDGYRSIGLSSFITSSIDSYFTTIYKHLIFNNYVLNIVLSACILITLYRYLKNNKKHQKLIAILSMTLVMFPLYTLIIRFSGINLFLKYTKYINGLFSIIYFFSILGSTFFMKDLPRKRKVIFALGSILVLTAPLFVVTPIGGRCFFPMYAFWIWITVEFFQNVVEENEFIKMLLIACSVVFFGYLLCIYGYIFKVNQERLNYINKHLEDTELVLPKLPYQKYMWNGDPVNEEFTRRFKLFYGIDEFVDIEFVSLKEWNKIKG